MSRPAFMILLMIAAVIMNLTAAMSPTGECQQQVRYGVGGATTWPTQATLASLGLISKFSPMLFHSSVYCRTLNSAQHFLDTMLVMMPCPAGQIGFTYNKPNIIWPQNYCGTPITAKFSVALNLCWDITEPYPYVPIPFIEATVGNFSSPSPRGYVENALLTGTLTQVLAGADINSVCEPGYIGLAWCNATVTGCQDMWQFLNATGLSDSVVAVQSGDETNPTSEIDQAIFMHLNGTRFELICGPSASSMPNVCPVTTSGGISHLATTVHPTATPTADPVLPTNNANEWTPRRDRKYVTVKSPEYLSNIALVNQHRAQQSLPLLSV